MRHLILLICLSFSINTFSQTADFIVLKRKGKTSRSYFAGAPIEFVTKNGAYRNGYINGIRNDSVYLQEFVVRQMRTNIGSIISDTAGSFRYVYHYKDILIFGPPENKKFNWRGSGSSLMGGAILLILGSGVVYLADRDNFSPALMGGAAALGVIGYGLNKAGSKSIVVGKRGYSLEYMDMTP